MDIVITVDGLRRAYRDHLAVAGVSFGVRRGEIFGILGPNGAGKTTVVECLQGLRRRDSGRVDVLGLDPDRAGPALRRRIGSQLQSSALPERLRVGEAIALFARRHASPVDVAAELARWDLTELRRRPFAALSGGQRQRLFLALALLGDPEVVFLDELTTGLDPAARRATWRLIGAIRDAGTTVVLVTHLMEEAEALCDRVAIVDEGRLIAIGTPGELTAGGAGPARVTFTVDGHDPAHLSALAGVASVSVEAVPGAPGRRVSVDATGTGPVAVAAALAERGVWPTDFRVRHPSLEDVFLALTGRRLTEGDPS
jgi:ABC-2 type transport system ATP-binding protein